MKNNDQNYYLDLAKSIFFFETGEQPDMLSETNDFHTVNILAIGIQYTKEGSVIDKQELNALHDIFLAIFKKSLDHAALLRIWINHVPKRIKIEGSNWGVTDTVIRDKIYVWAEKQNLDNLLV